MPNTNVHLYIVLFICIVFIVNTCRHNGHTKGSVALALVVAVIVQAESGCELLMVLRRCMRFEWLWMAHSRCVKTQLDQFYNLGMIIDHYIPHYCWLCPVVTNGCSKLYYTTQWTSDNFVSNASFVSYALLCCAASAGNKPFPRQLSGCKMALVVKTWHNGNGSKLRLVYLGPGIHLVVREKQFGYHGY